MNTKRAASAVKR